MLKGGSLKKGVFAACFSEPPNNELAASEEPTDAAAMLDKTRNCYPNAVGT